MVPFQLQAEGLSFPHKISSRRESAFERAAPSLQESVLRHGAATSSVLRHRFDLHKFLIVWCVPTFHLVQAEILIKPRPRAHCQPGVRASLVKSALPSRGEGLLG